MNNYSIHVRYCNHGRWSHFTEEYTAWTIEEAIHQCKAENHFEFTFQEAQIFAIWQEEDNEWRSRDWD